MPQYQNPWLQVAGVGGGAAEDLGRLMLQIPAARANAAMMGQEMQLKRQSALQNAYLAQQQEGREQQLFPLQKQQLQARTGLIGQQGELMDERARTMAAQTQLLQSKQAELEQKLQAVNQFLQSNPNAAGMMYSRQPQFRQGGGMVYDAFTGQPSAMGPRVLNPGQSLTGVAGMGQVPGIVAQSPYEPVQHNGNVLAAIVNAVGAKGIPPETFGMDTNRFQSIVSGLMNNMTNRPVRSSSNALPNPTNQVPTQTNTTAGRLTRNPDGSFNYGF